MNAFWSGPVETRTCKHCGTVIERAGAIALKKGKIKAASAARKVSKKSKR